MCTRIVLAFLALLGSGRAVLLDRIAVTAGKDVITESEIDEEIRVTAFLNKQPLDFSPAAKRQAAERLIDQDLIRRDMELTNGPQPEASEADKLLAQIKRERFANDAEYRQALARYGITGDELNKHMLWQLAALRYTEFRFNAGNKTPQPRTDEDGLQTAGIDQQMDAWLKEERSRIRIVYHEEALK